MTLPQNNKRLRQFLFISLDLMFFFGALYIALWIRSGDFPSWETYAQHLPVFGMIAGLGIVINYIIGLYDGYGIRKQLSNILPFISAAGITALFAISILYIFSNKTNIAPKTILLLTLCTQYIGSYSIRVLMKKTLKQKKHKTHICILGYTEEVAEILPLLTDHIDYHVSCILSDEPISFDIPRVSNISEMSTTPGQALYVTRAALQKEDIRTHLYQHCLGKFAITPFTELYEELTGKVALSQCTKEWFIQNIASPSLWYLHLRTLSDYLAGIVLGIITILLLPCIAIGTRINSKGPVFFSQQRIGQEGHIFSLYKFRSMYVLSKDGSAEKEGAQFSVKGDPRITPFGRWLRKTRIDELPQAWNLLRRDISLIGPRPERPEIVKSLLADAPYFSTRTLIKPGITGWAAVKQHYTSDRTSTIEKLQYDLYYIKHQSIMLDIKIALLTIRAILQFRGQ